MNVETAAITSDGRFHAHFEEVVRDQLAAVNGYRKRTLRRILGWWLLLVPSIVGAGWGLHFLPISYKVGEFVLPVLFFALLLALVVPYYKNYDPYRKNFKEKLVAPLISAYREGLLYDAARKIEQHHFVSSGLYRERTVTNYSGEDRVDGRIGDTQFSFSEVDAENVTTRRGSDGKTKSTTRTIFRGLFYVAGFNKHFNGTTYVLPDRAQKLLGGLGQALQSDKTPYGELVKLEDPDFEREFVVYSSSQIEARYILSSALMQRIHALKVRTRRKLRIGFAGSHLYIAIASGKNHFEPRLFRSVHRGLFREYWDVLDIFVAIIDELNLNTRIWSKA